MFLHHKKFEMLFCMITWWCYIMWRLYSSVKSWDRFGGLWCIIENTARECGSRMQCTLAANLGKLDVINGDHMQEVEID